MEVTDKTTIKGRAEFVFTNVKTGKKERIVHNNLITTVAKESIADRLRGSTTSGNITFCALGTNATAPALGDTQLGTEIFRKQIAVRSATNNVALFEIFFNTEEANAALKEAGLFGDGASSTANSGTLFSKVAIDRTKTSSETLSVAWEVIIG